MQKIIIRLLENSENAEWVIVDEFGKVIDGPNTNSLADISQKVLNKKITVIVPGIDVLITQASVPKGLSGSNLRQAISFALEDQVGEQLEKLHFAIGSRISDNRITVAVINQNTLEKWLEQLAHADIFATQMIPEQLAIPYKDNIWHAVKNNGSVVVRIGPETGFVIDITNFANLLTWKLKESEDQKPEKIIVTSSTREQLLTQEQLNTIPAPVEFKEYPDSLLQLFAEGLQDKTSINLLQGKYRLKQQNTEIKKLGLIAASLAALWLALVGIGNITQYIYYKIQNNKLTQQITSLYLKAYPNATSVSSPQARIQQDLTALSSAQRGSSFYNLLASVAYDIHKTPKVKIESISFQDNKLTLNLQLESFQQLEQLIKALSSRDLSIDRNQATTSNDKVKASFSITNKVGDVK